MSDNNENRMDNTEDIHDSNNASYMNNTNTPNEEKSAAQEYEAQNYTPPVEQNPFPQNTSYSYSANQIHQDEPINPPVQNQYGNAYQNDYGINNTNTQNIPPRQEAPPQRTTVGYNSYQDPYNYSQNNQPYAQPAYNRAQYGQPQYSQPYNHTEAEKTAPTIKKRSAIKTVAIAMAIVLACGASGAAGAYLVVNNMDLQGAQTNQPQTPQISYSDSSTASPSGKYADITAVAAKVSDSVVEITTESKQTGFFASQYVTQGAGSGVILTQDGYIATNHHVVDGAIAVKVRLYNGEEYDATFVGSDKETDLAVIKIEAQGLSYVTFADSDAVMVGELAIAVGNPLGELGGTVTDGIISAKDRNITIGDQSMKLLQTSAAVNPGNSGGGLFNQDGNLVGIVNAKSAGSEIEGLAFAIPSNTVKKVVDDIIEFGYVTGRPQFGISVVQITDPKTAIMYRLPGVGLYVAETERNNGFMVNDRILYIDGEEINISSDLLDVLDKHKVGDTLSVTVERNGEQVTFETTLAERIPEEFRRSIETA